MTDDTDWLAAAFEQHRDHLRGVAYRLLGSMSDAEDAVQDTWLRLTGADTSEVENLGGWLTTVVARVSLNMLRSRRHRQEEPVGDTWPSAAELAAQPPAAAWRAPASPVGPASRNSPARRITGKETVKVPARASGLRNRRGRVRPRRRQLQPRRAHHHGPAKARRQTQRSLARHRVQARTRSLQSTRSRTHVSASRVKRARDWHQSRHACRQRSLAGSVIRPGRSCAPFIWRRKAGVATCKMSRSGSIANPRNARSG